MADFNSKYTGEEIEGLLDKINESASIIPITYNALYELCNNDSLTPGAFYRIIDYMTETSQTYTRSAGHQFDIIAQALDSHTLSENASAIQHEGDTYFSDSDLASWKLKYSINNDTNRWYWCGQSVSERAQSWTTSWGVLESKTNAEESSNYTTALVDSVTKYLYAPSDRGTFLNNYTFYRVNGTILITSYTDLIFKSPDSPYEYEGEESGETFVEWGDVYYMYVYAPDGTLVTTLRNYDYDGYFYEEDDYDFDMMYPVSFDPNPTWDADSEVYIYTPSYAEDWWESYRGGSIEIKNIENYTGSVDALYYAFDQILPQSGNQPSIQVYSSETGLIYESDDWSDSVTWTSYIEPSSTGKGVIYEMIDENNNQLEFDFKNIQFYDSVGAKWYYSFGETTDLSLSKNAPINNNIFSHAASYSNKLIPIVILGSHVHSNNIALNNVSASAKNPIILYTGEKANAQAKWFLRNNIKLVTLSGRVVFTSNVSGCNITAGSLKDCTFDSLLYSNFIMFGASYTLTPILYSNATFLTDLVLNTSSFTHSNFRGGGEFSVEDGSGNLLPLYNSDVDLGTLGSKVKLRYTAGGTISSKNPLGYMDIKIPNNSTEQVVDINSNFPLSSTYTLKIATNSNGEVKQWCDADLVQ